VQSTGPGRPRSPADAVDLQATPVANVMSPSVVAVPSYCDISVAVDRFLGTGMKQLVVVDSYGRPAGLLSRQRVGAAWLEPQETRPTRVHQVMEPVGSTIGPQTSVRTAAELMVRHDLHAVPVVDSSRELVGVVTHTDLVRLLAGLP
jgi:CBS-domain-containing membrane protein